MPSANEKFSKAVKNMVCTDASLLSRLCEAFLAIGDVADSDLPTGPLAEAWRSILARVTCEDDTALMVLHRMAPLERQRLAQDIAELALSLRDEGVYHALIL